MDEMKKTVAFSTISSISLYRNLMEISTGFFTILHLR